MWLHQITLISLTVLGVSSDSHTLRYFYTAVSAPGSGLPEFSAVGYVDDQEFINYNSESKVARPVTAWMEENEGSEYWDEQTNVGKGTEPVFRHNVRTAMSRLNQTGGIHIVQWMYGCELRDDGSTAGYEQDGYDGRDFMYLDTESWLWIPAMHEAQITTQRWNSPEVRDGEISKNYLENICIPYLKTYIGYGREDLERRVLPEVKVWGRQHPDGVTRLQCLAYGFHPREVDVKWVRNGEVQIPSDEASPILPHPDGTYQKRVSVEVPTREGDIYSCHVDHSSLEKTLSVAWEPDNGLSPAVIAAIAICSLVVVAAVIAGVVIYKKRNAVCKTTEKKKEGYKITETSDTGSESSNNQPEVPAVQIM